MSRARDRLAALGSVLAPTRARTASGVSRVLVALAGLTIGAGLTWAPHASAVPPGGASDDTPGTKASISASNLTAGDSIHFVVSGFPGGEVVYVKIDDGKFCAEQGVHGACVVHQQRIPDSGTVSGSFQIPADLQPGKHWLRFLASQEVQDDDGNVLGVKGFTCRGNADFTLTRRSSNNSSGNKASLVGTTAGATTPPTRRSATSPAAGAAQTRDDAVDVLVVAAPAVSVTTTTAPIERAAASRTGVTVPVGPRTSTVDNDRVPYPGITGLIALIVSAALIRSRTRRRARA